MEAASVEEILSADVGSLVWVILGVYLASLLGIGAYSAYTRRKASQKDESVDVVTQHYTASSSLGFFVTSLTLFATLFSGYTVIGLPSEAYQTGFSSIRWIGMTGGLFMGYALIVPRLRKFHAFRNYAYASGTDFVSDRFRNHELRIAAALTQLVALTIYMLAQFRSIAVTIEGFSNGAVPGWVGAIALAVVMFMYEIMGGMQSVAWTDVIQGVVMLGGMVFFLVVQSTAFGGLANAGEVLANNEATAHLIAAPSSLSSVSWLSFQLIMFFFILYPHQLQRVYAAKSDKVLRHGLSFLALCPMFVFGTAIILGIVGRAHFETNFPGQELPPDQIFGAVMRTVLTSGSQGSANYIFGSIILSASVAALMSTADSALLGVSSTLTLEIVHPYVWKKASKRQILWVGRLVSFVVTVICVSLATVDITMGSLLKLQQNIITQLGPIFVAGLYWKNARPRPLLFGLIMGWICSILFEWVCVDFASIGFAAGVPALVINLATCFILHHVNLPFFQGEHIYDNEIWDERFGTPLPQNIIGIQPKGIDWPRELVHKPYSMVFVIVALFTFIGVPWYYPGEQMTLHGGIPGWVFQSFVAFTLTHIVIVVGYTLCWHDHEKREPSTIKEVYEVSEDDIVLDTKELLSNR